MVPALLSLVGAAASVIAVVPVGATDQRAIERLAGPLRQSFGAEIVIAPPIALPRSAYDAARRQYRSRSILDALAAAKRPEWDRLLGVADVDLYSPDLNFVFGEADSRRGVAVFSVARLESADAAVFDRRAATEAIHELGHAYGLSHCDDPHCVMWFSNTLAETDRKGTRFCARHAREIEALAKSRKSERF